MAAHNAASGGPQTPVILIIDDEPSMRFLTRRVLEGEEQVSAYTVEEADDGEAGRDRMLALIADGRPTLVICDYRMPKINGLDVARAYHGAPRRSGALFVLVSVLHEEGIEDQAHQAGVDLIVERPAELQAWRDELGKILARWQHGFVQA